MHLNIRSLRHKMFEVKCLVKEHNPHIFGISETELVRDTIDEKILKIPGYNILFPSSWSRYGFARVLVYVRKIAKLRRSCDSFCVHKLQETTLFALLQQITFVCRTAIENIFCTNVIVIFCMH